MKIAVIYIALLTSLQLSGQIKSGLRDTVLIDDVVINGRPKDAPMAGFKKTKLDSLALKDNISKSMGELLSANTRIFVKSYGPGTSATSSSRGTGANHTYIAWNGIKINNPMLGQADLSLLPSGMIDEAHVYQGGGSMEIFSGGLGSAVNMLTIPEWNGKTDIITALSAGTYGRMSLLAKINTGRNDFRSVTKFFAEYSENNFRYPDPYAVSENAWLRRENNRVKQNGFMQEFYLKKSHHQFSARFWHQYADRQIPVPVLVSQLYPGEKQKDESTRALLNYDYYSGIKNLNIAMAILSDRLDYLNPPASVDSKNKMLTGVFRSRLTTSLTPNTTAKISVEYNLTSVNSNNYSSGKINNTLEVAFLAETFFSKRISTSVLVRETLLNDKLLIPDLSAGLQFKTNKDKESYLKTNFSRNSRIPSLNDMYWMPGGNPDLKNEYAATVEIGWEMSEKKLSHFSYKYDITVFRSFIRDMIKWTPGNNSLWYAANLSKVNTSGIEASLSLHYSAGTFISDLTSGYSFTRAADISKETGSNARQLIYVPFHQINNIFRMGYRSFSVSLLSIFTGRRYTDSDNTRFLPGYLVNDLSMGMKFNLKIIALNTLFVIENLFNEEYQNTAWYPMPGRSFMFKLTFENIRK